MSHSSTIEFDDIQGLLRFGHGQLKEACFLLLEITDAGCARDWLTNHSITTAEKLEVAPKTALQVAFTAEGLSAMGLDQQIIEGFSDEFVVGMSSEKSRSRRLGDTGNNAPADWFWGNPEAPPAHVLIMLYATTNQLELLRNRVLDTLFDQAFVIRSELPTFDLGGIEPFGFLDGISQPKIDWERTVSTDVHQRDQFSNLLSIGEILLGYPNEYGRYTTRPLLEAHFDKRGELLAWAEEQPELRDFGRNGSYLVMRQLQQDVPGFWKFMDAEAKGDAQQREKLAAAMVGRRKNGEALVPTQSRKIEGIKDTGNQAKFNQFDFDQDPLGHKCPIGAHIRRANPRTGDFPAGVTGLVSRLIRTLGFGRQHHGDDLVSSTRFHRMLRRGRAYGSPLATEEAMKPDVPSADRGLHFICLVANISRQFEFLQNAWLSSSKFAGLQNETDPLLGNRQPLLSGDPTDRFTQPGPQGPAKITAGLPQFINVIGGGYFFMPGLRALRFLCTPPPDHAEK